MQKKTVTNVFLTLELGGHKIFPCSSVIGRPTDPLKSLSFLHWLVLKNWLVLKMRASAPLRFGWKINILECSWFQAN